MASATPSAAAQPSVQPGQREGVEITIKAIRVDLKSRKHLSKSTVKLTIGDTIESKSFLFKLGALQWNLNSPREILPETSLKIHWISGGKLPIEVTLSYEDLTEKRKSATSILSYHEYEYDHERAKFTVLFRSKRNPKLDIQPEDMKDVVEKAARRKSILDRIGKSKGILRTAIDVGGAFGKLHPVADAVMSGLDVLYKKFEDQDEENKDVLDLLIDMSDIVHYTFDMEQFATVEQLKVVIEEARVLMQEATNLVFKRGDRSNTQEILSILTSEDREKIQDLKSKLARFKQNFDRAVNVQSADTVEIIKARFEKFASVQEEYTHLRELTPHFTTPDPPRCLPGTREDILATIREWTNNLDAPNILWIGAYPGAGKSTIAFTIAAELERSHRMGTIFAFDRKSGTKPSILWRHVAFCLAREYPSCRDDIVTTLKGKPSGLANMTATEIFHQFVAKPLQQWDLSPANIPRDRLPVLIIDALDECGGLGGSSTRDRKDVLSHIGEWSKLSHYFKLIITSRIEDDIKNVLSRTTHKALSIGTADTVSPQSTRDIQRYIEHRFKEIAADRGYLPLCWPGKAVVDDLTSRASGVFIWAATALNYIEDFPDDERLSDVQGGALPSGDVHALYRQLLTKSFSKWSPKELAHFVKLVGTIVVAQVPLTAAEFRCLLGMKEATVGNICNGLRPVLAIGDTLRFAHPSFVDFLLGPTDPSASDSINDEWSCPEAFRIDPGIAHYDLVESMFRFMNAKLCFNICNIESSFVRNAALPQIQNRPLSYACRFWGFHVEQTRHDASLASSNVTVFLREKLLFWLEALGVLGAVNVAATALTCLGAKLPVLEHTEQAVEDDFNIVKDAVKLAQYFAPAIAESAPHIYISCLPFAPRCSSVANLYAPKFGWTISLERGQLQNWPAEQTIIRGHGGYVGCVAFSPDGKRVVSGSSDNMIRMWHASTGHIVAGPFNGHTDEVRSVAFSPDGKRVLSGSLDNTIRIWDAGTGQTTAGLLNGEEDEIPYAEGPRDSSCSIFTHQSVLYEHGWMKGPDGQLLFWVPSLHRLSLHRPSNVAVCGPNETRLDVSKAVFGHDWARCYTPS